MKSNEVFVAVFGLVLAGGLLCVGSQPALAHHSATMFDTGKVTEITGAIKEFQWANPHVWIQVYVPNASGVREEWSIEGGGPNSLSRQGWRVTTFKPGDVVTIRMNPMRDGTHAGLFIGAKFSDEKTIGRWEQ